MKQKIRFALLLLVLVRLSSFGQQQGQVDRRLLVGEWTRNESTCQIKIKEALDNGKLELTYFNPKEITIGKAYWTKNDVILSIYVELQDEDFPGSYYKLNYNKERDMLVGSYFDVADESTQAVEFVRTKH